MHLRLTFLSLWVVLISTPTCAQAWLDAIDDALSISSRSGGLRADLSMLADLDLYVPDSVPQGTLSAIGDDLFLQPRLSVFLDVQSGKSFTWHAQMRVDRGFDPGSRMDGDARLEAYYLQWNALSDDRLVVRAGRFSTGFGAWVPRHLSWDNPFVDAPMAYSDLLPLTDAAAPTPAAFATRRNAPDNIHTWVPILWGASYATGASMSGRIGNIDYLVEIKNATLSSRPQTWDAVQQEEFRTPATITARLGWHPAPEWTLGSSFSQGPWMINDDARQTTLGIDATYAYRHWQVWAEAIHAHFEVPGIGSVSTTSAFIESKYKILAGMWVAARWNQSWNGDLPGFSNRVAFDRNAWRADLALGYRLSQHSQLKLQYSVADKFGESDGTDNLLAAQLTIRF